MLLVLRIGEGGRRVFGVLVVKLVRIGAGERGFGIPAPGYVEPRRHQNGRGRHSNAPVAHLQDGGGGGSPPDELPKMAVSFRRWPRCRSASIAATT